MSSLPSTPASSVADDGPAEDQTISNAEAELSRLNSSWSAVALMTLGLYVDDEEGGRVKLMDVDSSPFTLARTPKNKKVFKPSLAMFRGEVLRRYAAYYRGSDEKQPSPKGWVVGKCLSWLETHPIPVPSPDVDYLIGVVLGIRQTILRKFTPNSDGSSRGKSWYGELPVLRLSEADPGNCMVISRKRPRASATA